VKDRQLDGRTDRQTDGIAVERIALRNGVVLCECWMLVSRGRTSTTLSLYGPTIWISLAPALHDNLHVWTTAENLISSRTLISQPRRASLWRFCDYGAVLCWLTYLTRFLEKQFMPLLDGIVIGFCYVTWTRDLPPIALEHFVRDMAVQFCIAFWPVPDSLGITRAVPTAYQKQWPLKSR